MTRAFSNNLFFYLIKDSKSLLVLFLLMCGFASSLYSQKSKSLTYDREISLFVDNDAILMLSQFDKYYSSGIYLSYRKLLSSESGWHKLFNKNENLSKTILSYTLEHRFFTPRNIKDNVESKIDRPYAGWVDMAFGLSYHFNKQSVLTLRYDLGLLGPGTKSEELQIWFHNAFGMKEPRGWKYQINNTLATNFSVMYQKELYVNKQKGFDIISESSFQAGTIRDNIRTGLAFRLGRLGDMAQSVFTKSNIGQERVKISNIPAGEILQEIYLFYRIRAEYVIHNTTIDGNIIGERSDFTKSSLPWIRHQEFGIARGGRLFDMLVSFHHRTKENEEAKNHQYVTIALTQRF